MTRAAIVTRWIGDGLTPATANRPAFVDDFPLVKYTDATNHPTVNIPPSPNVLICEIETDDATLAAIKADGRYGAAAVLWEGEPDKSPVMTAGAYNTLVTFLANKFGVSQAAVRNVLTTQGAVVDGVQTRYDFAVKIIGYLRTRPKA